MLHLLEGKSKGGSTDDSTVVGIFKALRLAPAFTATLGTALQIRLVRYACIEMADSLAGQGLELTYLVVLVKLVGLSQVEEES